MTNQNNMESHRLKCAERHGAAVCRTCGRVFNKGPNLRSNLNNLRQHEKVHRPRNVACPLCGDRRFASGVEAVQHVEAGVCPKCTGKDRARDAIYGYAAQLPGFQPYLSHKPALTYGGGYAAPPPQPYVCRECNNRPFKNMSSLMQHQNDKHGNGSMFSLQY